MSTLTTEQVRLALKMPIRIASSANALSGKNKVLTYFPEDGEFILYTDKHREEFNHGQGGNAVEAYNAYDVDKS